jgi:HlyD family secretion protein
MVRRVLIGCVLLTSAAIAVYMLNTTLTTPGSTSAGAAIEAVAVTRGALRAVVAGSGLVEASMVVELKSRASGKIVRFEASEGDDVLAGQLLIELDGIEEFRGLQVAETALAAAKAELSRTQAALEAFDIEHELALRSEAARVASAQAQLERTRVALQRYEVEHPSLLATLESRLVAAVAERDASGRNLERLRELHARGATPDADLDAAGAAYAQRVAAVTEREQELGRERGLDALVRGDREQELKQLAAALAIAEVAHEKLERTRNQNRAMAEAQLRAAEARAASAEIERDRARERAEQTKIASELDGVLVRKLVEPGQIIASGVSSVSGGTPLAVVADLDTLYVVADVDESDIGRVAVGQRTRITVDAHPELVFEGRVHAIAPQGVTTSNVVTFKVRIMVHSLRRQMLQAFVSEQGDREAAADWGKSLGLVDNQHAALREAFTAYAASRRELLATRVGESSTATRERRRVGFLAARRSLEERLRATLDARQYARYDERLLRIGMSAAVEVEVGALTDALIIPAAALRQEQGRRGVYRLEGERQVFLPIGEPLLNTGDRLAIAEASGLRVGDQLVLRSRSRGTTNSSAAARSFLMPSGPPPGPMR